MQIVIARKRITGTLPHFEYRVLTPFDQISVERQALIHTRSDYGFAGGPWARTREVIAPMSYLRLPPGLARFGLGKSIGDLAKRIDTLLVRRVFPEMTAPSLPLVFAGTSELRDAIVTITTDELTARHEQLVALGADLCAHSLGLTHDPIGRAA